MKGHFFVFSFAVLFSFLARAELTYSEVDFQYLYNNFRYAQPAVLPWPGQHWSYEAKGHGSGINHVPPGASQSPAQKYDSFFGTGGLAANWEEQNHTCKGVDLAHAEDCRTWYGHSAGWTGAALHSAEPANNRPITITNPANGVTETFTDMDIKALLSEVWQDAEVSLEGTGMAVKADDWIFEPDSQMARKPADHNPEVNNYQAYWDVTPRTLFFALTNDVGIQKIGIAIDGFAGAQVRNQPIAGYRFLPLSGEPLPPLTQGKKSIYPVQIGLKIYWANDNVPSDFRRTSSLHWDIANPIFSNDSIPNPPTDPEAQDRVSDSAILSRYISFTLFFDAPVTWNKDGTQVLTAGKIVGDGVWTHSDPDLKSVWYSSGLETSQLHPDFVWRPERLTERSFRNPYIDPQKIHDQILRPRLNSQQPEHSSGAF